MILHVKKDKKKKNTFRSKFHLYIKIFQTWFNRKTKVWNEKFYSFLFIFAFISISFSFFFFLYRFTGCTINWITSYTFTEQYFWSKHSLLARLLFVCHIGWKTIFPNSISTRLPSQTIHLSIQDRNNIWELLNLC